MADRRVALVTGGGGGIGAAISRALAAAGAFVFVAGRDTGRLLETVVEALAEEGHAASTLELDVTDPESIARALGTTGPVDWLVNNAGIAESASIAAMIERGYGRVIQIASSAALGGYTYVSAYTASKHALLGYTRCAALELTRSGVALNVLCPHYVDSPMTDASVANIVRRTGREETDVRAFFASQNPGGILVTPEEIGAATLDLLSGDRTGVVLELIGGSARTVDEGPVLRSTPS
ncbi:MAG: SDR family oxidoreductase [bacterium]|nr:SDR family oxidoreductase [bacterium]